MPRTLAKIQKHIRKKHGSANALHENSRNSQRLRRGEMREDRLNRVSRSNIKSHRPHLSRVAFFQDAARGATGPVPIERVQGLIQTFINRDDEELSKIKEERRPGRPMSTREDQLKQRIALETKEHETGFYLPDMEDGTNLERLSEWNGQWASLSTIKFMRLTRGGIKSEAGFTPSRGD